VTQRRAFLSAFPLVLSAVVCGFIVFCYLARPDACAAVTVFPVWVWPVLGLALAAIGWRRPRWALATAALWLAFLAVAADEPVALLRLPPKTRAAAQSDGEAVVRVVTLNCASSARAVENLVPLEPDIVLVQESPTSAEVARLAAALFGDEGGFLQGADASILARGRIEPRRLPAPLSAYVAQARVRLASGADLDVVCLRLRPALVRLDLWSPDCWRDQAENRRQRRAQLQAVVEQFGTGPPAAPLVVAGDFNAPAGDAVFRLLEPPLTDAFAHVGSGWGNTITSDFPFARIDQVWAHDHCRPVACFAVRVEHSDHRAVVCDVAVPVAKNRSE
jgi:endonuclease/exonuclease/phosphatase (EEP) superfamily protein YafD